MPRSHTKLRSLAVVVAMLAVLGTRQSGPAHRNPQPSAEPSIPVASSTTTSTTTSTTAPASTSTTSPAVEPPPTTVGPPPSVVVEPTVVPRSRTRCVVRLHGKGGSGAATTTSSNGGLEVKPRGNAQGWGGWQWLYFPAASYASAVGVVQSAITANGCTAVAIDGFSNGAAFAAKLACRGETFGGTVLGYVVDDPVPDHGTDGCALTVPVALYWTGGLASIAVPGWMCSRQDWTCEGAETIGIAATGANLGVPVKRSVNTGHSPYLNPPELRAWLG